MWRRLARWSQQRRSHCVVVALMSGYMGGGICTVEEGLLAKSREGSQMLEAYDMAKKL